MTGHCLPSPLVDVLSIKPHPLKEYWAQAEIPSAPWKWRPSFQADMRIKGKLLVSVKVAAPVPFARWVPTPLFWKSTRQKESRIPPSIALPLATCRRHVVVASGPWNDRFYPFLPHQIVWKCGSTLICGHCRKSVRSLKHARTRRLKAIHLVFLVAMILWSLCVVFQICSSVLMSMDVTTSCMYAWAPLWKHNVPGNLKALDLGWLLNMGHPFLL